MSLTDLIAGASGWYAEAELTTRQQARQAVLNRRFGIRYRPIVDTRSGPLIGCRTSARFAGPDGHELPPARVLAALHAQPPPLFHAEIELERLALARSPPPR